MSIVLPDDKNGQKRNLPKSKDRGVRRIIDCSILSYCRFGRSGLVIFVLIILSVLIAQSRRNCEVPGSTWIPCIWGSPLNHHNKHRFSE
jgi:hypothetical protein